MKNYKLSSIATILMCAVSIIAVTMPLSAANIVINGDFEAGNTGFTSSYTYVAPGGSALWPEGVYTVDSNPQNSHPGFTSMSDHTTTGTQMLIANGSSNTSDIIWQGSVSEDLAIGTNYDFSAWLTNVSSNSPASLTFSADGVVIGTMGPTGVGSWQRLYGTFTATTVRPVLKLTNAQSATDGNDFAVDDINIFFEGTTSAPSSAPETAVKGNNVEIADGDTSPTISDFTDFGSAAIAGGTVSRTFTIENSGDGDLSLSGSPKVAISGTNAADFSVTTQPTSPVSAAGSTTFTVQFDPSATGTRTATISIANDDSDENPYDFAIQGSGTAPDMDIEQNNVDIANGGSFNFGNVWRDQTSPITFTILNEGDANLNLSGSPFVTLTGDAAFSVTQQPTSPIAPSGSSTFIITFAPTDTGVVTASLSISNDDAANNPYTISLSGRGVFPFIEIYSTTVIADGDVTPSVNDSTDFGLRHIPDGIVTRTFYVENVGNADLTLTAPGVVLTGSSDFSVATQLSGLTIAPGNKLPFAIKYSPAVNDTVTTSLSVPHNSDYSPYTFDMQGIGGLEEIELTAAVVLQNGDMQPSAAKGTDFGDVYTRETQDTLSMTVKNTGNWPLGLTSLTSSNNSIFSVLVDPAWPAELKPDSSLTFDVVFDPETDGPDSSLISIVNSDADETPFTFLVKGEGTWLGSIKAIVWHDKNANGAFDQTEEGIRDVLVLLNQEGNPEAYAKHLTNAGGWAKFNRLKGQNYVVNVDESTLPGGGVCTTGSLTKSVIIGASTQMSEAKFGIFWEDTTAIKDHIGDSKLPWDADLIYHSGSPEFVKEPWNNAVDKDLFGWDGTATVGEDENGIVWGTFEVENGPCQFNRVTLVTDDGTDDNAFQYRHAQVVDIYVSRTGPDSADFTYAATVKVDNQKVWPPIYKFDQTFVAKYVKIVIVSPDLDQEWRQITEFALGELDEALSLAPPALPKQSAEEESVELPTEYSLGQNYPNPFNPTTTINYTLPEAQNVDIAVYNIKGDLVKQLASGYQDAGVYNISWDATNAVGAKVTTGVYFYRITAGSFTETKKMTLMQ